MLSLDEMLSAPTILEADRGVSDPSRIILLMDRPIPETGVRFDILYTQWHLVIVRLCVRLCVFPRCQGYR